MIIDRIEHSRGTLSGVEYVSAAKSLAGFTCIQVRKPGASKLNHVEIAQVKLIEANGRSLVPRPSNYHEPIAAEIKAFLEGGS